MEAEQPLHSWLRTQDTHRPPHLPGRGSTFAQQRAATLLIAVRWFAKDMSCSFHHHPLHRERILVIDLARPVTDVSLFSEVNHDVHQSMARIINSLAAKRFFASRRTKAEMAFCSASICFYMLLCSTTGCKLAAQLTHMSPTCNMEFHYLWWPRSPHAKVWKCWIYNWWNW